MAQGMKELRRRIRSVTSIQKITRAMEMVASTRLRRMQARAEGARPYADSLGEFSALLAERGAQLSVDIAKARETVKRIGVLVIGSDRGLCGSYNANVYRKVAALIGEKPGVEVDLYVLGKKPRQHYARRLPVKVAYPDEVEKLGYRRAKAIARELTDAFLKGGEEGGAERSEASSDRSEPSSGVDEVWVVYTRFISAGRQLTTVDRLLPVVMEEKAGEKKKANPAAELILLEPSLEELFRLLMPKSLAVRVFAAMLDSMASEQ